MSENFRHHRASREIVFVAVPVPAAGSPAPLNQAKPPRYPSTQREPWRPAQHPPRRSKAQRLVDLMRELDRRAEDARAMLRPTSAQGLKACKNTHTVSAA
jgi:hypothetical protein